MVAVLAFLAIGAAVGAYVVLKSQSRRSNNTNTPTNRAPTETQNGIEAADDGEGETDGPDDDEPDDDRYENLRIGP